MTEDAFYMALLERYGRIYNPEANAKALAEKQAVLERRAALAKLFPAGSPPRD